MMRQHTALIAPSYIYLALALFELHFAGNISITAFDY